MSADSTRSAAASFLRRADRIVALFDGDVVGFETRRPVPEALLYPEEASLIERAVEKRRQDFAGGRLCARRALAEFDIAEFPLLIGENRFPIWPESVQGSITHTRGYCASVVVDRARYDGIGVDVERRDRLDPRLEAPICTDAERSWLTSLPSSERGIMATVIFSAKEAFYKSQYCVTRQWLAFHDAEVQFDGDRFEVRLLKNIDYFQQRKQPLVGRFAISEEHVFTAIALPAEPGQ